MIENIVGSIINQAQGQMQAGAGMPSGPSPFTSIRMAGNPLVGHVGGPGGVAHGPANPLSMMFRPRGPSNVTVNNNTSAQNTNQQVCIYTIELLVS